MNFFLETDKIKNEFKINETLMLASFVKRKLWSCFLEKKKQKILEDNKKQTKFLKTEFC